MQEVKIKGIYKHYKGNLYIIEDIGTNCETLEKEVIYRALYEDNRLWIRPLNDFIKEVNKNGQKHRFELQEIESIAK